MCSKKHRILTTPLRDEREKEGPAAGTKVHPLGMSRACRDACQWAPVSSEGESVRLSLDPQGCNDVKTMATVAVITLLSLAKVEASYASWLSCFWALSA